MRIIEFQTLPSTNDYLKENYLAYENEDVILALDQSRGRGRFKRAWISGKDLTFTILFKNNNYHNNLIAPLAIVFALRKYGIHTAIKWPNDIYLHNKKLAGVLCESIYEGDYKKCDIVGIGLNTSKKDESLNASYVTIDRHILLDDILYAYKELLSISPDKLLIEYKKASFTLNMDVIYQNEKFKIIDYTTNLEIVLDNNFRRVILNANEIDLKSAMMKK